MSPFLLPRVKQLIGSMYKILTEYAIVFSYYDVNCFTFVGKIDSFTMPDTLACSLPPFFIEMLIFAAAVYHKKNPAKHLTGIFCLITHVTLFNAMRCARCSVTIADGMAFEGTPTLLPHLIYL